MNIKGEKIAILGLARSGIAAADLVKRLGGEVFLSEMKPAEKFPGASSLQLNYNCEFGGHTDRVLDSKILVVSPGIPLSAPIVRKALDKGIEVISEIELGFRLMHPSSRVIAVTGSNGKSTTVSLIHHILESVGYTSVLAGNIGVAYTGFPIEQPGTDFYVLEISSFQLEAVRLFKPTVAVLLNITPDHLNRYPGMNEYAAAKANIFNAQSGSDLAVLNADDRLVTSATKNIRSHRTSFSLKQSTDAWFDGQFLRFGDFELHPGEFHLKGPHNLANIMAGVLATLPYCGHRLDDLRRAVAGFLPLSHRLEYVATVRGVDFVNDSKATNTDSVHFALQSFDRPIRIILGGSDKGEDYTVLRNDLSRYATKAYLIGETRAKMEKALAGSVPMESCTGFREAMDRAFRESRPGDIVLLSPACASYDMFRNFEDRGDTFKAIVHEYQKGVGA
jgi:UDP-N-acetylmuramoylalanine--D-glutamate ligase